MSKLVFAAMMLALLGVCSGQFFVNLGAVHSVFASFHFHFSSRFPQLALSSLILVVSPSSFRMAVSLPKPDDSLKV